MARRQVFTTSLASGEIAPEYMSRTEMASRSEAAQQLTNVDIIAGGGVRRRPGTRLLQNLGANNGRLMTMGVGPNSIILLFIAGAVKFLNLDGSLIQQVSGAPWGAGDLRSMQVALGNGQIVVTATTFTPQLLTLTNGVWAISAFQFSAGPGGQSNEPYYRFPGYAGVTLTPAAYSGSTTVAASAPVFFPGHIGARFRYIGVEMVVTGYLGATLISVNIVGNLYPSITVNVFQSNIFSVGDEIVGFDSGVKGICVSIPDSTHIVVQLTSGYASYNWTSLSVNEKIVGPTGMTTQLGSAPTGAGLTPAPMLIWDESLISAARGYPGSCGMHRTRLLLGNFPAALNVVCASALGDITDFDVGTGLDSDAIVELVVQDASIGIRHFGSTEQLLFFTQSGAKYVPEQVGAPLSPTNFDLLTIGPEAAGAPVPFLVAEGMLFVEDRSGRLMAAIPTGNVRRSWNISDLSEMAFHLMGTPVEIGLLAATTTSDRRVIVVRDDGQIAVMSYRRSTSDAGWRTWNTVGAWQSAVAANGSLYMVVERPLLGGPTYCLEILDPSAYGDCVVSLPTLATAAPTYAWQMVSVWSEGAYIGDFQMDGSGVLTGVSDSYSAVDVGFDSQVTIELVPPIDGSDGLRRKIRLCRVDVEAINSGAFTVNGYDPSGFPSEAGVGGAVELQSGTRRFRPLGRSVTGTATIVQQHAGPLEVRSITMEVTS